MFSIRTTLSNPRRILWMGNPSEPQMLALIVRSVHRHSVLQTAIESQLVKVIIFCNKVYLRSVCTSYLMHFILSFQKDKCGPAFMCQSPRAISGILVGDTHGGNLVRARYFCYLINVAFQKVYILIFLRQSFVGRCNGMARSTP